MQLLKKLLGGSKKEGYFLELDEIEESQSAQTQTPSETKTPSEKAESLKPEKTKSEVKTVVPPDSQKTQSEQQTADKSDASPQSKPTSASKSNKFKSASLSQWDGPDWAKQLIENSQEKKDKNDKQAPESNGFASDSLLPIRISSRRMPGPSLNKFMDMAKQVKTPK